MSVLAMSAYHRLRVDRRYRLDGTARLVLYHLCWRHDEAKDVAWPSTAEMASDLDIHRSSVTSAIVRLENARLIIREQGGGRGRSTRYKLRFLAAHRLDPNSKQPIDWHYKVSGPPDSLKLSSTPDSLESETVRQQLQNCPAAATKTVRPTGHERHKDIKTRPPAVAESAGGRTRTADEVFRESHRQRRLALLASVDSDSGSRDQPDAPDPGEPDDRNEVAAVARQARQRPG